MMMVHGLNNPSSSIMIQCQVFQRSNKMISFLQISIQRKHRQGRYSTTSLSTTKTVLFIDRIIQLLKPGGRAAVTFDGVLFGSLKPQGSSQTFNRGMRIKASIACQVSSSHMRCINRNTVLHQRRYY